MKIALFLIMCSSIQSICMPPFLYEKTFNNHYDCLLKGYQMSIEKLEEIGKAEVNLHGIYVKFECKEFPQSQKKPTKMVNFVDLPKGLKNGH